ncbi:hypothetical protein FVI60_08785 [Campylobacter jejuni]|nr:hypothetical protein [Campylobacter jejuni]
MEELKEQRYYIKLPILDKWSNPLYLNFRSDGRELFFANKEEIHKRQTRFTQTEIVQLQQDERTKNLNLNALKVKVQDDKVEED